MKSPIKKLTHNITMLSIAILLVSCSNNDWFDGSLDKPTLTLNEPDSITNTSAIINCKINGNGMSRISNYGVQYVYAYSQEEAYKLFEEFSYCSWESTWISYYNFNEYWPYNENMKDKIKQEITNLTPNSKIFYRMYLVVLGEVIYSEIRCFETKQLATYIMTGDATQIKAHSATLNGIIKIDEDWDSSSISYEFEYCTNEDFDFPNYEYCSPIGSTLQCQLTNLLPNTTYYYRICLYYDCNYYNHETGEIKSFTTLSTDTDGF